MHFGRANMLPIRPLSESRLTWTARPVTVVGVLPENFDFGSVFSPGTKVDLFTPAVLDDMRDWGNILALVGRMKPGVTIAQAQADADIVTPRLILQSQVSGFPRRIQKEADAVDDREGVHQRQAAAAIDRALVRSGYDSSDRLRKSCQPDAGAFRNPHQGVRTAPGAWSGPHSAVRQLLTESMVLSLCRSSSLVLALAYAITSFLAHQGSIALPMLSSIRVDGVALGWSVLIAVSAAMLFGTVPGTQSLQQ
jgi:hypothetical protein